MTPARDHGSAGKLFAADPGIAGKSGLDAVPVIDLGVINVPESLAVQEGTQVLDHGMPAGYKAHHGAGLRLACSLTESRKLLPVDSRRLLQDQVLFSLESQDGLLGVQVVGHADGNHVYRGVGEEVFIIGIHFRFRVELLGQFSGAVHGPAAGGSQVEAGIAADGLGVLVRNLSGPPDSDPQFFFLRAHSFLPKFDSKNYRNTDEHR